MWRELPTWPKAMQVVDGHLAGYRHRAFMRDSTVQLQAYLEGFHPPSPRSRRWWCRFTSGRT